MSCSTCTRTIPINRCLKYLPYAGGLINLGVFVDGDGNPVGDTAIYIYLTHVGTGKTFRFEDTTDVDGNIWFAMDVELMADTDYEIYITTQDAVNISDKENIEVANHEGGAPTTDDCFIIRFKDIFDSNGEIISYQEQTIQV